MIRDERECLRHGLAVSVGQMSESGTKLPSGIPKKRKIQKSRVSREELLNDR